jgi:serine protease AprX
MDGKSTLVTRSANMAASKGMLVINAAGNDGDKKWEVIGAPADADSVLSIGGVSPGNGYHIKFSSYGPTFDGRMKPNLVAFGQVTTSNKKKIRQAYGTSFATPLVSGFAACVIQIHPEWSNMEVFREMEKSGHLYPYFDYAHGYGVPQASYFTIGKQVSLPTFEFQINEDNLSVILVKSEKGYLQPHGDSLQVFIKENATEEYPIRDSSTDILSPVQKDTAIEKTSETGSYLNQQNLNGYALDENYLYFHITRQEDQKLKRYAVVNMQFSEEFNIPKDELEAGDRVTVYYRGYVNSYEN